MKKKDKLKDLVSNFIGSEEEQQQVADLHLKRRSNQLTEEEIQLYGLTPEQAEKINLLRDKNKGRKKGKAQHKPALPRATFVVSPTTIHKMKYIALAQMRLYKDTIDEALTQYIKQWEKENGEITFKQVEK